MEARLGASFANRLSVQTLQRLANDVDVSSKGVLATLGSQIPLLERSWLFAVEGVGG